MIVSKNSDIFPRNALLGGVCIAIFGLLIMALLTANYNTLAGDDLYFVHRYHTEGVIESIGWYYMHWTGRISNILLIGLLFSLIPDLLIPKLAIIISLGGLIGSCYYLLRTGVRAYLPTVKQLWLLMPLSMLAGLSFAYFSKVTYDDFYWVVGVITYVIPIIVFNVLCARIIILNNSRRVNVLSYSIVGLLALFMSMLNEVFSVQVLIIFLLWWLISLFKYKRANLVMTLVIVCTTLGILALRFAPGTSARLAVFASINQGFDTSMLHIIPLSFTTAQNELQYFFGHNWLALLGVGAFVYVVVREWGLKTYISNRKAIIFSVLSVIVALMQFVLLAFLIHYSGTSGITNYTLLTAYYFAYVSIVIIAGSYALTKKQSTKAWKLGAACILTICSLAVLFARINTVTQLMILQKDQFIQQQNQVIYQKQQGKSDIVIGESVRFFSYCAIYTDPKVWCNTAASAYYGVRSITAERYNEAPQDEIWMKSFGLDDRIE